LLDYTGITQAFFPTKGIGGGSPSIGLIPPPWSRFYIPLHRL